MVIKHACQFFCAVESYRHREFVSFRVLPPVVPSVDRFLKLISRQASFGVFEQFFSVISRTTYPLLEWIHEEAG